MLKARLFIIFIIVSTVVTAQKGSWVVGPAAGVVLSDMYFQNLRVNTTFDIQPIGGLMATYLPEKRKPGIKLIAGQMSFGFTELTTDGNITYRNSGLNFQFLNYIYIPIRTFRLSFELGPAISYYNNPRVTGPESSSVLPSFSPPSLNTVMLDLQGGIGLAQPIGRIHISAHSVFAFSASKVYKNLTWLNNPLALQVWVGLQYQLRKNGTSY